MVKADEFPADFAWSETMVPNFETEGIHILDADKPATGVLDEMCSRCYEVVVRRAVDAEVDEYHQHLNLRRGR